MARATSPSTAIPTSTAPTMPHGVHCSGSRIPSRAYVAKPCIRGTIPLGPALSCGLKPLQVRIVDDRPDEPFEELFEPFQLEGAPTGETRRVEPRSREVPVIRNGGGKGGPPTGVPCPSCGTHNPPFNRHCDSCGARLSQAPLPVAPQPMLRTTAGARALMVLAGVILTVALLALAVNLFRRGDATAATTTTSTTTAPVLDIEALEPMRIDCTSELPSFPCDGLIDGDPTTDWNAEAGGVGAVITILFNPPVQISEIIFYNLDDPERFARNARIKGIEIKSDDLPQATIEELLDSSQPQRIQLASLSTARVEITITSAYPGETYDGKEPFPELALKELAFYGRLAPQTSG